MDHGWKATALLLVLTAGAPAEAVQFTNRSFEQGDLTGWATFGDVSAQSSAVGTSASHGDYMAAITTLGSGELPYSGTPAVIQGNLWPFILGAGLDQTATCMGQGNEANCPRLGYDTSAISQQVDLRAGDKVSFDYKFVTADYSEVPWIFITLPDGSTEFLTLGINGLIANCYLGPMPFSCWYGSSDLKPSAIDLCSRAGYWQQPCYQSETTRESDWITGNLMAPIEGSYKFAFGIVERFDDYGPNMFLLDNFRIRPVPEPGTLGLLSLGLLGLVVVARYRRH